MLVSNWKCNGKLQAVKDLIKNSMNTIKFEGDKMECIVAPSVIHIAGVKALLNPNIQVGCQNMSSIGKGSLTGEIQGEQLKDFDISWIIIGHCERKLGYGETDEVVQMKLTIAQDLGLQAIVCVCVSEEDKENGTINDALKRQLTAIKSCTSDWSRIVIVFQPIWAIGTGKTASPDVAQAAHSYIR